MSIITWDRSHFKHEDPSRVELAREAEISAERNQRQVARVVTQREGGKCRVCGRRCDPDALSMLKKGHHHHIVFRSAGGEDSTANECLLCAGCHDEVHVKKTLAIEGNADVALTLKRMNVATGEWYVDKQEIDFRIYERD
jgi:5-methylcytosine-specific restriction endonuclease McrA